MTDPTPISVLVDTAIKFETGGYELQRWANGILFLEAPNGEGTEVPEEAVAGALAELFRKFF
jgi:hypothetical protein